LTSISKSPAPRDSMHVSTTGDTAAAFSAFVNRRTLRASS